MSLETKRIVVRKTITKTILHYSSHITNNILLDKNYYNNKTHSRKIGQTKHSTKNNFPPNTQGIHNKKKKFTKFDHTGGFTHFFTDYQFTSHFIKDSSGFTQVNNPSCFGH